MKPYYESDGITLYRGDCREVLPYLSPGSVDLIWTDPPYGHDNHEGDWNARLNEHRGIENKPIANDGPGEMRAVMDAMLHEATRLLNPEADCCCCCCCGGGPKPTFAWVASRMDRDGLSFFHSVIWDKINPGLGWRYRRQHEMVMVAHRTGARLSWNEELAASPNILRVSPPREREHPNEKPIELVSGFVQRHSLPNAMVLDPFAGSGTTLVAAKRLGRRAVGIELDEAYCEIATRRIEAERLTLFEHAGITEPKQEMLLEWNAEIDRCDSELAAIDARDDLDSSPAYLSTMGRMDWETEKRLIKEGK